MAPELSPTAARFAGHCMPLRIGEIQLDAQGRIRPAADAGPLRLGYSYRGVECDTEFETGSEPRVRLSADLGKLPYSTEIGDGRCPVRRIITASLMATLAALLLDLRPYLDRLVEVLDASRREHAATG